MLIALGEATVMAGSNARSGSLRLARGWIGLAAVFCLPGSLIAGSVSVPVTAMWDFDSLDPLEDVTGNGHHLIDPGGTYTPGFFVHPTPSTNGWDPNGLKGRGVAFDGSGDYLEIPGSTYSGGDFTLLVAEMRPNTDGSYDTIAASTGFRFQDVNNKLTGAVRPGNKSGPGGNFGGTHPHAVNDWHLVALRYDSGTRALDTFSTTNSTALAPAKLTGSVNAPGFAGTIPLSNFRLGMDGVSTIGGDDAWAGELDFAIFHDGLLTDTQLNTIAEEFNNSPNVLPPQLPRPDATAKWDFNGANPLADRTGNGHDLLMPASAANQPSFVTAAPSSNGWEPLEFVRGPVAEFDGSDWLDIPDEVYEGGDFTVVAAHRRPASAGGFDTILSSSRFRYQDVNNSLQGDINSPGGSFGGSYALTPDDWYFTVLRYEGATGALNSFTVTGGDELGSPVLTGNAVAPGLGNAVDWQIGYNGNSGIGGVDGWAGQIDFVAFYNDFVIADQLELVFEQFRVPEPSAAMLAVWAAAGWIRMRRRRR